jgi:hypothetical protein
MSLRGFRPFEGGQKKRGVYARMDSGASTLIIKGKRQALGGSWVLIPRGCTIEIAGQRVSWS